MKLYGEPGWGSVLVEAQLVWYGLDFDFVKTGDLFADASARAALQEFNPLAQIPTLSGVGLAALAVAMAAMALFLLARRRAT